MEQIDITKSIENYPNINAAYGSKAEKVIGEIFRFIKKPFSEEKINEVMGILETDLEQEKSHSKNNSLDINTIIV